MTHETYTFSLLYFSLLEHKPSRKRERKTSTSSTASAASKKSKKFEVSTAEVKPEATILENLPGYGGPPHGPPGGSGSTSSSLRNLMPPPPDHKLEAQEEQPQHQPQTQSHNYHNEDEFQVKIGATLYGNLDIFLLDRFYVKLILTSRCSEIGILIAFYLCSSEASLTDKMAVTKIQNLLQLI